MPAALHGIVEGVFGLDNRRMARRATQPSPPQAIVPLTPRAVADLYQIGGGAGETIGLLEFGGGYTTTDIQAFFSAQGLTMPAVTPVGVDGAANSPDGQNDNESSTATPPCWRSRERTWP